MNFPGLPARLAAVRESVARSQKAGGWSHPVRIVAVTKTHGADAVQEALQKQEAASDLPVEWHLIGTLQRNKARHAAGRFGLIHSVDRADLAAELDRRLPEHQEQAILVQVNCSAESQKGGVAPEALAALLDQLAELKGIRVRGLMTMSALTEDAAEQRRAFRLLRQLRDAAEQQGHTLPELSMGMSGDYPVAVEEGATMIRLGTVLFGERTT
jgi:pyridoxal phosphate enzyme (YggS family)